MKRKKNILWIMCVRLNYIGCERIWYSNEWACMCIRCAEFITARVAGSDADVATLRLMDSHNSTNVCVLHLRINCKRRRRRWRRPCTNWISNGLLNLNRLLFSLRFFFSRWSLNQIHFDASFIPRTSHQVLKLRFSLRLSISIRSLFLWKFF